MSRSERLGLISLVPALFVALFLRTYRLPGQLLIGDEWHALHRAMHLSYADLLSSFGISDHSIALALYFRVMMDTAGLSDVLLRAPFLIAGLLTVLVIPLAVRREMSGFTSCALAWLLALSPLLVFFSRFARPYSVTLLCSWIGAFAVREWWNTGRRGCAFVFWACSVVTGYLLVIALPFVLGAFVFLFFQALRRPRDSPLPGLRALAWLAFVTLAALAALLIPALVTDFWSLSAHPPGLVRREGFTAGEALGAFEVLAGAAGPWGRWLVGLLACLGAVSARRRARELTDFLLVLCALQITCIYVALPAAGTDWKGILIGRYLLPALPALLLFVAAGIEALAGFAGAWQSTLRPALTAALSMWLLFAGPLPSVLTGPVNWVSQQLFAAFWYGPDGYREIIQRVPPFYRDLGRRPARSLTLVETPSYIVAVTNPLPRYQEVHRQDTLVGLYNGLCGHARKGEIPWGLRGIALRNYVFLADPASLLRKGASHVVFHRRMGREATIQPVVIYDEPDLTECIAAYRLRFGAPTYEDGDIVVFDLRGETS